MTTINKHYRILIVKGGHGGIIIQDIDLKGYNLDKSIARASIMDDIDNAIKRDMAKSIK